MKIINYITKHNNVAEVLLLSTLNHLVSINNTDHMLLFCIMFDLGNGQNKVWCNYDVGILPSCHNDYPCQSRVIAY